MKTALNSKYALTIVEASEYFHIGQTKLRRLIKDNPDEDFYFMNGTINLIKREKFEDFLNKITTV